MNLTSKTLQPAERCSGSHFSPREVKGETQSRSFTLICQLTLLGAGWQVMGLGRGMLFGRVGPSMSEVCTPWEGVGFKNEVI